MEFLMRLSIYMTYWVFVKLVSKCDGPIYAEAHGMLIKPASRVSAWRFGYKTPYNYNDMEMWCGGLAVKQANGGKCGVCGDRYDGTRSSEVPNGEWVTKPPTLTGDYVQGDRISVTVNLTAAHKGYFVFRLCPAVTDELEVTQQCLDQYPLEIVNGSPGDRFKYNLGDQGSGVYQFTLILPRTLTCARCVLQWDYTCRNQGPTDIENETFRACADIRIRSRDETNNEIDVTEQPKMRKALRNSKDCWWTGCQKNDWAIVGCEQYDRVEEETAHCPAGKKYKCCK